eukprot:gene2563-3173_t
MDELLFWKVWRNKLLIYNILRLIKRSNISDPFSLKSIKKYDMIHSVEWMLQNNHIELLKDKLVRKQYLSFTNSTTDYIIRKVDVLLSASKFGNLEAIKLFASEPTVRPKESFPIELAILNGHIEIAKEENFKIIDGQSYEDLVLSFLKDIVFPSKHLIDLHSKIKLAYTIGFTFRNFEAFMLVVTTIYNNWDGIALQDSFLGLLIGILEYSYTRMEIIIMETIYKLEAVEYILDSRIDDIQKIVQSKQGWNRKSLKEFIKDRYQIDTDLLQNQKKLTFYQSLTLEFYRNGYTLEFRNLILENYKKNGLKLNEALGYILQYDNIELLKCYFTEIQSLWIPHPKGSELYYINENFSNSETHMLTLKD